MGDQPTNKMNHAELSGLYKGRLESLKYSLVIFELFDEDEKKMKKFQSIIESLVNNINPTNTQP